MLLAAITGPCLSQPAADIERYWPAWRGPYVNGRIYQLGGTGLTYNFKDGPELEIISENKLDDTFSASPAIAGDEIFLRGHQFVYCIAEK